MQIIQRPIFASGMRMARLLVAFATRPVRSTRPGHPPVHPSAPLRVAVKLRFNCAGESFGVECANQVFPKDSSSHRIFMPEFLIESPDDRRLDSYRDLKQPA